MYQIIRKSLTFVALISMLINSLAPFTYALPQTFAQEVTPSPTDTPTPTETPAVTQAPIPTETPSITPEATPSPTEVVPTPTQEVTPTPIPTQTTTGENNSNSSSSNNISSENQNNPTPTPSVTPSVTPVESPSVSTAGKTGKEDLNISVIKNTSVQSLNLQASNVQASATLTTDKADYSPTDTAVITGTNLMPKATYMLFVSSTDPPAVNFSTQVTTNEQGSFTYGYQLDGTYRPNYKVELKDLTGNLIISTTFTDSASSTTTQNDQVCLAQQPGQAGLVCTANDISIASVSSIIINGHGCRFPGDIVNFTANWQLKSTANQRYNVGLWFATGGQASALSGTCSVTSLPSSPDPFFDNGGSDVCGDINKTTAAPAIPITMTAVCNPDSSGFLKLPYCTTWQQNEQGSTCTQPIDTLPGTGSKCSCQDGFTIPVTIPPAIEVIKSLSPTTDSGLFNLKVNGNTQKTDAGDGGKTGKIGVTTGSNNFGEEASTNTDLSNYSSSASCVLRGTTTAVSTTKNGNTWTIANISNGQDIVCTITNTRINNAQITVVKDAQPNSSQSFGFTTTGGFNPSTFNLVDNGGTNSAVYSNLSAGNYSISENSTTGWTLLSVSCTDDTTQNSVSTPSGSGTGTIALGAGQHVTCTFTNTRDTGSIVIVKSALGGDFAFPFSVTGPSSYSASPIITTFGGTGVSTLTVNTGTGYSVTENVPAGWSQTSVTCTNGSGTVSNTNFAVTSNGTVTCTFVNTKQSTLTVNKVCDPVSDNGKFNLQIDGVTKAADASCGGSTGAVVVSAASHTVGELAGAGSVLSDYTTVIGGDCGSNGSVTLAAGENKTCTITNTLKRGTIIVKKVMEGGTDSFTFSGDAAGTISANNGTITKDNLLPGTYTSTEGSKTGWTLSSISCDDSNSTGNTQTRTATFNVGAGETVICTFTNTRDQGSIELKKVWSGTSGTTTLDIGTSAGGFDIAQQLVTGNGTTGAKTVDTGIYYVSENGGLDNYTSSLSCTKNGDVYTPGENNLINVGKNDSIICTYTNIRNQGTIQVKKIVDPADNSQWDFTISGPTNNSTTLSNNGTSSAYGSDTGSYTLTEIGHTGTNTSDYTSAYSCVDQSQNVITSGTTTSASFTLSTGKNIVCTFTNTIKRGNVIVTKYQDNDASGTKDTGEPVLSGWTINLSSNSSQVTSGNGVATFSDVLPNTYTLSETFPDDTWIQSNITCDNGRYDDKAKTYSLTASPGSTVNCSIGNYQLGHIKVVKNVVKPDGSAVTDTSTQFPFSVDYSDPFNLTDGGQSTVDVNPGPTHVITETPSENYDFTGCESSSGGSALDLPQHGITVPVSSGQTVTVTCTNKQKLAKITVSKLVEDSNGQTTSDTTNFTVQLNNADPKTIAQPSTNAVYTPNPGGPYTIAETGVDASKYEALGCKISNEIPATEFSLSSAQEITVTCTNKQKPGTISGTKFDELGNVLARWTINLFACSGSGVGCGLSPILSTPTLTDGTYSFSSLLTGFYQVAEVMQTGWTNVSALFHNVTINPGTVSTGNDFTNKGNLSITACKYERSGGLNSESQTTPVDNWTFKIGELSKNTGTENNCTTFGDLKPGTYTVSELPIPEGWFVADGSEGTKSVVLTDSNVTVNFFNYKKGGITGMKWNDVNGDGRRCTFTRDEEESQVCEKGLAGWTIFIDKNGNKKLDEGEQSTITGTDGGYSFTDLNPGTYQVCEVIKPGWEQTYPVNTTDSICHSVTVTSGTVADGKDFGNHSLTPVLKISKSNNTGGATMAPGNEVLYTITVKVEDADANGVKLVDLLPSGFKYKAGSWTANSDVRGNLKPGTTGEPTYASPGTWQLGNMVLGETVILTLIATIDGGQHPGTYKDVAWAEGSNVIGDQVLAQALPTGYVDTNFVGTDVLVGKDENTTASISVKRGDVLGAMTELPATGANNIWVIMSGIVFGAGLILTIFGAILRKKYAKKLI